MQRLCRVSAYSPTFCAKPPGSDFSRGYIQSWFKGDMIPEKSAQKIFHVADQILKAGQVKDTQNHPTITETAVTQS